MDEGFKKVIRNYTRLILEDAGISDEEHVETAARMLDYIVDLSNKNGGGGRTDIETRLNWWKNFWELEDLDEHDYHELLDVLDEYCDM
jgi:hypothetical protein